MQLYKLGRAGYWRLLLDVNNLQSIGRAYRTAAALTRLDRERVQQHERTLTALARRAQGARSPGQGDRAAAGRAPRPRARRSTGPWPRGRRSSTSIDARRDLNAQLTGELEAAQQRLQSAVTQLGTGRRRRRRPCRSGRSRARCPGRPTGIVTGRFGRQSLGRVRHGHLRNGIEISLAEGQVVRAVHEGTVAYADLFTGYGNLVIVDHGDGELLALRPSGVDVRRQRGDRVEAGEPVGTSGRNPSGNPALYFELRVDGKPVDPLQWLKR